MELDNLVSFPDFPHLLFVESVRDLTPQRRWMSLSYLIKFYINRECSPTSQQLPSIKYSKRINKIRPMNEEDLIIVLRPWQFANRNECES